jgi:large subunit ribosomal protein L18
MRTEKKLNLRQRRHWRVRKKVVGTGERPRMSVRFTGQHIYVQFIDDIKGVTVAQTSTRSTAVADRKTLGANVESAQKIGSLAAEAAKSAGISQVVFDRSGAPYHGKVKALAEAAREAGIKF